jgi:hypothetical protein
VQGNSLRERERERENKELRKIFAQRRAEIYAEGRKLNNEELSCFIVVKMEMNRGSLEEGKCLLATE